MLELLGGLVLLSMVLPVVLLVVQLTVIGVVTVFTSLKRKG